MTTAKDVWGTESEFDSSERVQPETEYKPKVRLVLEDSETAEWGLVKDCHGAINHIPEDADIVGTWNRYGTGTYWISLTVATEALLDRHTQLTAKLAADRKLQASLEPYQVKKTTKARVPREPKPVAAEAAPDPLFSSLRDKLTRK